MNRIGIIVGGLGLFSTGCGGKGMMSSPDMAAPPDLAPLVPPPAFILTADGGTAPANLGCLGKDPMEIAPTMDTIIMGNVTDFQDSNVIVGATVNVYFDGAAVSSAKPVASSAPTDMNGKYTLKVPPGHYRVIFSTIGGQAVTSSGKLVDTIPTYEFERPYSDGGRTAVKVTTRDAIPGLVSVMPDTSLSVLAGGVRDCDRKETGGALVTITASAAPYASDKLTFYFVDVSGSTFPSRTKHWTQSNGVFAALNVPAPGTATVTASVVLTPGGPLTPLPPLTVPLQAGAITILEVRPNPGTH